MRRLWTSVVISLSLLSLLASTPGEAASRDKAPQNTEQIGLEIAPTPPDSRRVGESNRKRMARIESGELQPRILVPFRLNKDGYPQSGTRFYDEAGRVYRYDEAVAVLTRTYPNTSEAYRELQQQVELLWGLYAAHPVLVAPAIGAPIAAYAAEKEDVLNEALTELLKRFNTETRS